MATKDGRVSKTKRVKAGSAVVKIYETKNREGIIHTVAYYSRPGLRKRINFASAAEARVAADRIAIQIQNGDLEVLKLTNKDRGVYLHALELLRPLGSPLDIAISEYVNATRELDGTGSVIEAAKFFKHHHSAVISHKVISEVVNEFLKHKKNAGLSLRYLEDCKSRLKKFSERFTGTILSVTTAEIQTWLEELKLSGRSRNNLQAIIVTLFRFAQQQGYIRKNQSTEADGLSKAKNDSGPIQIFNPEEMALLLKTEDKELILYLAIGAFSGLRSAELRRLSWPEIHLEEGHIEVTAGKAKTAQRRIIPIQENLRRWIAPFAKTSGNVFTLSTIHQKASNHARKVGIEWPNNVLRHSFASYRLAQCKSAPEVSLEMGNSPKIIVQHYRKLVTESDSVRWWNIGPRH